MRRCPRGYEMVNGVCTEVASSLQHISHINPGDGRLDCEEACEYLTPSNCEGGGGWGGCGCACCIGYWQPCFGDWSNTGCQEWVCDCGMCMGEFNACVNSCVQTILTGMGAGSGQRNWNNSRSDIRLKENIELVGESPSGINIYEFDYINKEHGNERYRGVMAQEVPEASYEKEGHLWVDYSKLDVDFEII